MIIVIKFNGQLERKETGQNGFLVAQTVKRHENKNKDEPTKIH